MFYSKAENAGEVVIYVWFPLCILVTMYHVNCDAEFQQLLCQDDQLILIKSGFFEVWMTRMARMFDTSHMTLLFTDGNIVPRAELEIIFSVCICCPLVC